MLLTRSPLYSRPEGHFRARLACIRHAASVHSEPGSNSPVESCNALDSRGEATRPSAVIPALVASGNKFPEGYRRHRPWRRAARSSAGEVVVSLSDVISDGRRGRRGIDADYFLYSVFKEPAFDGRAPPWAEPRLTPPAATSPRHAVDSCPRSAEGRENFSAAVAALSTPRG